MHFSSALLIAAAGLRVAQADFLVYTVPPIPTDAIPTFANEREAGKWTTSVFINGQAAYSRFTESLGEEYKQSSQSAASEIKNFVQSASNFSIPAAVTDDSTTTSFFSMPDWYTALPTGARQFKEQQVSDQFSIVRSVIEARQTTASSTGGALPTARADFNAKFGVMAAAAAAAFL